MNITPSKAIWIVAGVLALIIQSALAVFILRYGHIGGEGPDAWGWVGLITMLPGAVIGEHLFGPTSPMCNVLGTLSGAGEWFLLFAFLILSWKFLTKHEA